MSSRGVGGRSQLPSTVCSYVCANQWVLEAVFELKTWFVSFLGQDLEVHMMLFERQFNRVASRVPSTSPASQHSEQMVGKCPKTCMGS